MNVTYSALRLSRAVLAGSLCAGSDLGQADFHSFAATVEGVSQIP